MPTMTLTEAKRLMRKLRADIAQHSTESLHFLVEEFKPQYKDGLSEEVWEQIRVRRYLEARTLYARLGHKRRSSIQRMLDRQTPPVF